MITQAEFTQKLETAGVNYMCSPASIVIATDHTLMFSFENGTLVSFVNGFVLKRVWDVKEVDVSYNKIVITDRSKKYEFTV